MTHHISFATARLEQVVSYSAPAPIRRGRALSRADGIAAQFIDLAEVPPGTAIGIHTHDDSGEELYVVISGTGRMHIDGREFPVAAGDVVVNRPGGTHGLANTGDRPLRVVAVQMDPA